MKILKSRILKLPVQSYRYKSYIKILRKTENGFKVIKSGKNDSKSTPVVEPIGPKENEISQADPINNDHKTEVIRSPEYRENEMKIQMLSKHLHEQVFGQAEVKTIDDDIIKRYHNELKKHDITVGESVILPDVEVRLPPLRGANVVEHFYNVAHEQVAPYKSLITSLIKANIPEIPKIWRYAEGWTKYDTEGNATAVPYPDEKALIFDTENCMREGSAPTLDCAIGPNHWYSWCSRTLVTTKRISRRNRDESVPRIYHDDEMIAMEPEDSNEPRIIIGHNVSFDRARIRNQYHLNTTAARFLDTMSMHMCVSGVTSFQRAMLKSSKELDEGQEPWSSITSLNGLVDVFKLYCSEDEEAAKMTKDQRSLFVDGTLADIQKNFQSLTTYCANDCVATLKVFKKLYPLLEERFPHPATLAGMLELGMTYLPVNSNWVRYINESDLIYKDLDIESKYLLAKRANQACRLLHIR